MNIRSYIKSDWKKLCEIHDLARKDELRAVSLEKAFLPLEIAAEKEDLFEYNVLIAEENGNINGFIAFNNDEIAWLYVDPSMYRNGVGKALVAEAIKFARGSYTIEVLQGNTSALEFYTACGFREIGLKSGQMPGNESFSVTVHVLSNGLSA